MLANSSKSIVNEELSEMYNISKCVETIHQQPKSCVVIRLRNSPDYNMRLYG